MANIQPAATVVLVRDSDRGPEVLMLHRSSAVSFARESWVFPGGKIDREDYRDNPDDIETAARHGAVRETLEETGLVVDVGELYYFSHWTTPAPSPRRYATWFFVAAVAGDSDTVVVDGSEIVAHRWYRPAAAIEDHQRGSIDMMPPTLITLSEMAQCRSAVEILQLYRSRPVAEYTPRFTVTERGVAMLYAGDAGYELGDADAEGSRHRCYLLDEVWRYEKRS